MDRIICEVPSAEPLFRAWLARGDAIGVFQNVAMDSANCGHLCFMPITPGERIKVTVGQTRAPDHPSIGLGWKYILQEIVEDIARITFEEPKEPEPREVKRGRRKATAVARR